MWLKMKMLLVSLMLTTTLVAEQQCTLEQEQLGLCQKLNTDLKTENELLGQKVSILTKQRDAAEAEADKASNPLLPTWTWVLLGVAVGGVTAAAIIKH
jgi:hypothetical protein